MSKESAAQVATTISISLQKRNHYKKKINDIFTEILQADSGLIMNFGSGDLNFKELASMLRQYQRVLLKELDALPIQCLDSLEFNHPWRAALALSNLNKPQTPDSFLFNLSVFTKEANNSNLYPKTTAIVQAITVGFVIAVTSVLCMLSFACPLLSGIASAFLAIFIADCIYSDANNASRSIYEAKNAANKISRFFNRHQPKPPIVENASEGVLSPASLNEASNDMPHIHEEPPVYTAS